MGCSGTSFSFNGLDNPAEVVAVLLRKENPPAAVGAPADPRGAEADGGLREKELVEGWPAAPVPNTKPGFVVLKPAKAEEGAGAAEVA